MTLHKQVCCNTAHKAAILKMLTLSLRRLKYIDVCPTKEWNHLNQYAVSTLVIIHTPHMSG